MAATQRATGRPRLSAGEREALKKQRAIEAEKRILAKTAALQAMQRPVRPIAPASTPQRGKVLRDNKSARNMAPKPTLSRVDKRSTLSMIKDNTKPKSRQQFSTDELKKIADFEGAPHHFIEADKGKRETMVRKLLDAGRAVDSQLCTLSGAEREQRRRANLLRPIEKKPEKPQPLTGKEILAQYALDQAKKKSSSASAAPQKVASAKTGDKRKAASDVRATDPGKRTKLSATSLASVATTAKLAAVSTLSTPAANNKRKQSDVDSHASEPPQKKVRSRESNSSSSPLPPPVKPAAGLEKGKKRSADGLSEHERAAKKPKSTSQDERPKKGLAQKSVKGARSTKCDAPNTPATMDRNQSGDPRSPADPGEADDADATAFGNDDGSSGAGSKFKKRSPPSIRELRGLVNHSEACFSNSVCQLLNAILSPDDLAMLQDGDESLGMFGLDYHDLLRFDPERHHGEMDTAREKQLDKLQNDIQEAAAATGVSIGKYVAQVIKDLRVGLPELGLSENYVTPFLLQQVFAYSSNAPDRRKMSGETQQDAHEYLLMLLDAMIDEHHTMQELFEIKQREVIRCTAKECAHQIERPETSERFLTVRVPAKLPKSEKSCDFADVLSDSINYGESEALVGYKCDGCGRMNTSERETILTKLPENLLVQVDRVKDRDNKIVTPLDLGAVGRDELEIEDQSYELHAVVRHQSKNRKTTGGHYTIDQLHEGRWTTINDKVPKPLKEKYPVDTSNSHSAILLLKKVKTIE